MSELIYRNKWDGFSIGTSVLVFLLIGFCLVQVFRGATSDGLKWFTFVICLLPLLILIALRPIRTRLSGETLEVHFLFHKKTLPLSDYSIRTDATPQLLGGIRLCASGGLFGYYGLWSCKIDTHAGGRQKAFSYLTHAGKDVCLLLPHDPKRDPILLNAPAGWFAHYLVNNVRD